METTTRINFPRWAIILYGALAVILIPWIIFLGIKLPQHHLATHWDAAWVGFDVMILVAMLVTLWFLIKGKVWVGISASVLATLFVVDVWFDVLTARPGSEEKRAIVFGGLELILAALTYRLVFYVVKHSSHSENIKFLSRARKK